MDPRTALYDLIEAITHLSGPVAYCTIVGILLICGFGVPIPEDITLITAGLLASGKSITLTGAFLASFLGVMAGDTILFQLGRRYGKRVFTLPGLRRLFTAERITSAEARIRKNGPFICFVARFLPGLRTPIFAMSGALGVRPLVFFLLDGLAALISVPLWVYVGFWFGENYEDAFGDAIAAAEKLQGYVFSILGVLIVIYVVAKLWKRKKTRATATTENAQSPQV